MLWVVPFNGEIIAIEVSGTTVADTTFDRNSPRTKKTKMKIKMHI